MSKLPALKGSEVMKALLKAGFSVHHQKGSHARLVHSLKPGVKATIPVHNKDLPEKTLKAIIKQAAMSEEDLSKLL